jgi:hypothetical protein
MTKQAALLFLRALILAVLINLFIQFSADPDTTAFQAIINSNTVSEQTVQEQ